MRFSPGSQDSLIQVSGFKSQVSFHPLVRILSALVAVTLFFSSSPALFALSARAAMMPGGGGKGSSANLLNAGAASAALTAAAAQAVQKKTDTAVSAMKALQSSAHAIMAPAGTPNGLAAGWMEPYNPTGKLGANNVPSTWSGVGSLNQSGNTVTVSQSSQNAYLYWKSFSVGPQTTLNFDQSAGGNNVETWIAFNKVMGTVNPTQILGSITAQGQVYVLNQNGILFGHGAQVNTHALVASTLPINANLAGDALSGITAQGIANNPDYQFLFSALPITAGTVGPTAAFTPPAAPSGGIGDVVVAAGASITAPANAAHTGGLVALIGPNVYNAGSISTPNGQTILAAGLQVGLNPHSSTDPSLRGMDVVIGPISDPSVTTVSSVTGIAQNSGYISMMEGNATIAGKTVQQYGVIDSSTSVALNGRIDLLANYNMTINELYKSSSGAPILLYQTTGVVELGAGSVMRILPEWISGATVTGTALALNSIVSIIGSNVQMGSGAVIDAPGAGVATVPAQSEVGATLASGVTIQAGNWLSELPAASKFMYNAGQISLASGAEINVAGSTDVQVNSSQNFLTLQLRGAELANSPLQRAGSVKGVNITIDARITGTYNGQYWIGTPLGDATGFAALIASTVGQLTEQGGSVSLSAGDSVAMQTGSSINVSGGWTQYSGGKFATTDLVYQGHLVNISQATPNLIYSGVYTGIDTVTYAKWGITKTFTSPLAPSTAQYEAPYLQGANGGSITIQAPSEVLNGNLSGNTVAGPRQLRSTATVSTLPTSSALTLDFYGQVLFNNALAKVSPYAPSVTFADTGISSPTSIILSPDLVSSDGFGNLTILNHDGSITLPLDTTLNAGVNGSVALEAANVNIQGTITAPGGSVSLTADLAPYSVINAVFLYDASLPSQPLADVVVNQSTGEISAQIGSSSGGMTTVLNPDGTTSSVPSAQLEHLQAGIVTVGQKATISTAGLLVNDGFNSPNRYQPTVINGGKIAISGYQVALQQGGVLDVSGGALLPASGSTSYGNAGTISLSVPSGATALDTYAATAGATSLGDIPGGSLQLGSTLKGDAGAGEYGVTGGTSGTLAISVPAIQIGGSSSLSGVMNLSPDFFNQGGFGSFNLTGVGLAVAGSSDFIPGIAIAPGTMIHPEVVASIIAPSAQGLALTTFTPLAPYRTAPNITLTASGLKDTALNNPILIRGDLLMGAGSSITLDPQIALSGGTATTKAGSVTLSGDTVAILGSITVPGGSITVSGAKTYPSNVPNPVSPLLTVDLAPTAKLSTAGEALFVQYPLGLRQNFGAVLPGGSISVSGNILAEAGSVLNASGASGLYDLFPYQLGVVSSTVARSVMNGVTTPYQIDSAGGSIALSGGQELYSEAILVARSGGQTAAGGSLSISSGRSYDLPTAPQQEPTDLNLAVSQSGVSLPSTFLASGAAAIGQAVAASGGITEGGGHIAVNSFASGGFDHVTLGGNVIFNGPITLSVPGSIKVATKGALSADSTVNLSASYVALGTPFIAPLAPLSTGLTIAFGSSTDPGYLPPTYGTGLLNITAQLIDIGNLSLQNIGSANLNATLGGAGGAIRGDGTLDIVGNLVMKAAEITPATGVNFTLAAYNHAGTTGAAVTSGGVAGSITVERNGSASLPLSAGGILSLYASSITQGGVLLAPFGIVNLGNTGAGSTDPVSGLSVPTTQNLTLTSGSITSVSAVDPLTGVAISVPYGTSTDGTSWVDPSGTTITTTGLSGKSVNLSAQNLVTQNGSLIDLQGGGKVTANEWISGNGGTLNLLGSVSAWSSGASYAAGALVSYKGSTWSARQANADVTPTISLNWTQLPTYYAILPGAQTAYAPTGYADGSIGIGSRVTLAGGAGLPAGTYTLLPASYGTQPGAYLISATFSSSPLVGSLAQPDGSVIVSGTQFNGLDSALAAPKTTTLFTLLSPTAIASRVQYTTLSAGPFFSSLGSASQPANAGNLVFQATTSMALNGAVMGQGAAGGTGARIDISTPLAIDITQNGTGGIFGDVVLGAAQLSSWSFGSLLLGGLRGTMVSGLTPVTVTASDITMASGATLTGNDIILAANDGITLAQGSSIVASGNSVAPDEALSVTGDGALLRVSSDQKASSTRSGSDTTAIAGLSIGAGATLSGASITLDSSGNASISPSAVLNGKIINLDAGKIALNFDGSSEVGSLNLSGSALAGLSSAQALNLTSYSSIDFHGSGVLGSASLASLSLHAGEILGDNASSDSIQAVTVLIDNAESSTDPSGGAPTSTGGALTIAGSLLNLGSGALSIGGFQNTTATLSGGIEGITTEVLPDGTTKVAGTVAVGGNLTLNTPILTGAASSATTIQTTGNLAIASSGSSVVTPGLGAALKLKGPTVSVGAPIVLPSGSVTIEATTGDLTVSSQINVAGTSKSIFNAIEYTSGGTIALSSDNGNVTLASGSDLNLSAPTVAGSAGSLSVSTPKGTVTFNGTLEATAPGGTAGSLTADLGSYNGGNLGTLETALTSGGFTQSQNIRLRSNTNVTVANVKAHSYTLSADQGSITVNGTIDASGENSAETGTGGSIILQAYGSVTLDAGSLLTVHADTYDAAGKGGSILLSAGAEINGAVNSSATLNLLSGSTLDLGVTATATSIQDLGGVLHLRTPESALATINLASAITGASSIEVEGYKLYTVTGTAGTITSALRSTIASDVASFYGSAGANSSTATTILATLDAHLTPANQALLNLAPGVEVINQSGGLTLAQSLNSTTGQSLGDWNLSTLRAGVNSAPGFLTLRASGSITFDASLSDGFQSSLYNAVLLSQNTALPVNFQSWAYQITAGADLTSANPNAVMTGSVANVVLGVPYASGGENAVASSATASTAAALSGRGYNYYQVIRTGTGAISIAAAGNLQIENQFASIYTAGVQVTDPSMGGTFDVPTLGANAFYLQNSSLSILGAAQQTTAYATQYSYAGGNIAVNVGGSIEQLALNPQNLTGPLIADSVGELPSNWLYRRGALAANGTFLQTTIPVSEVESTTWWVDFSNFFDDFGALGGGNITLNAAGNISNINASIPTNYRMPGHAAGSTVPIAPNAANGVQLGGGNLIVKSGNNIDAGVYYVENGNGSLQAGGSIITNPTRDPNHPASLKATGDSPLSYLPTTLFLGTGSFNVQAAGDILLGPVANAFLTPQGVNNSYWYKDYFSTYASTDAVNVQSLGGSITFREEAPLSATSAIPQPLLLLWMEGMTLASSHNIAFTQPWLRLDEQILNVNTGHSSQSVSPGADGLSTLLSIQPPSLNATALSGDITFQGNYTTMPSPTGNISLIAEGSINGLTDAGVYNGAQLWISAQVNLSAANPASVPGITDPISLRSVMPSTDTGKTSQSIYLGHSENFANGLIPVFAESGSYTGTTYGVLQTKEALNGTSLLHANDSRPLQFYTQNGDISGLTLYSSKQADISAGGNISDVGLYIQNNSASDVSVVSAGGNITLYDPTSPLQLQAQALEAAGSTASLQSGDIQISGPGTLEVLAGGNVDLGNNSGNSSDSSLSVGITSIGNSRNPNLPFAGADIIVGAGVKLPTGLSSTDGLALENFATTVLSGAAGAIYLSELAATMTYSGDPLSGTITAASFASGSTQLTAQEKAKLELQLFYIVLRDTGRNHNKVGSPGYGSYATGEQAIKTFFGNTSGSGNITMWSQDISTLNGGNIDLFAPGGGLTLASISSKTSGVAPGIITEGGGGISIYTQQNVTIGIGRIFTLKGGDITIWSDQGNIAAGASSKTVQSAPPTQVLIDPQSGNVETDLAGLATGGGIGVLETVAGVPPGNVDLIAPSGVIDAGDAGIRSSGNLNLAATKIVNADNIAATGTTSGAPPVAPPPAAPNISGATAASTAAAANNTAAQSAATNGNTATIQDASPSIISVEVLGYGGGDGEEENSPTTSTSSSVPPQASL